MFTVVKVYAMVYGAIKTDINQSEDYIRAGANFGRFIVAVVNKTQC